MELIEKLQKIIEREIDNVPMVLTDPLTLRRLRRPWPQDRGG